MRVRLFLVRVLTLAICGGFAGVILAAAVIPMGIFPALGINYADQRFESLPSDLRIPRTPQNSYVYANDGKTLITTFYNENRKDVPLSQIAPVMRQAMVAAEDVRFYQHGGVDFRSIVRAFVANQRGGRIEQGASTLTMQYVRNVRKEDPSLTQQQREQATADTTGRKLQEMRYAVALEQKLSKDDILDRYLNIAYFGHGAYGIYAASKTYFNKTPNQLTLADASLLAGLVQSPDTDNPITGNKAAALNRRTYVLQSMVKATMVSAKEAATIAASPLQLHPVQQPNGCVEVPGNNNDWGFFCDYFRQWWDSQKAFGSTSAQRERNLEEGGYRIVTSLNPAVQKAALNQSLGVYGYDNPKALPIAVVQPGSGRILAMAVNRHYSLTKNPGRRDTFPNTVNQLIAGGGGVTGYQSGSTFKMFTMLAALESGNPLDTGFVAPSPLVTRYIVSRSSCGYYYCPVNDNPPWMDGFRTMWTGYGRSVNTYFVWLEQRIGAEKAVAMAKRLGITFRAASDANLADNYAHSWGAFTLGVADTTPLDLANAYATVGAGGIYCKPLPVASITDAAGHKVSAGTPTCHRAISANVAAAATDAARCPVGQQGYYGKCDGGTAASVGRLMQGRPVAGKTGSSENNATETFVGFTRQVAAAGIAANPDTPTDAVGSGVALNVDEAVARVMLVALKGKPFMTFPAPSHSIAFGGP